MREGRAEALVVLGYHEHDSEGRHGISAVCVACVRRAEQIALARAPAVVLFTGWSSSGGPSEAQQMRELWGVDGPELLVEPQARNTAENAGYSLRLLRERGGIERVTVVCSIRHRIRAPYLFRANDFAVDFDFVKRPLPRAWTWLEEAVGIAVMAKQRRDICR